MIVFGSFTRQPWYILYTAYVLAACHIVACVFRAYTHINTLTSPWAKAAIALLYLVILVLAAGAYYYGMPIFSYKDIALPVYMSILAIGTAVDAFLGSLDAASIVPILFVIAAFLMGPFPGNSPILRYSYALVITLLPPLISLVSTRYTKSYRSDHEGKLRMCLRWVVAIVAIIMCLLAMDSIKYTFEHNRYNAQHKMILRNGIVFVKHPHREEAMDSSGNVYYVSLDYTS